MAQPIDVEKMKELYSRGYVPSRIAELLGVKTKCIYYIMRYYGIINDEFNGKNKEYG